jgi:hypothetical protein
MEDQHIFSVSESQPSERQEGGLTPGNKVLIGFTIAISVAAIIAVSYFAGTKSGSEKASVAPTPTEALNQPLFKFPESSPTPISTISAKPTKESEVPTETPTPRIRSKILKSQSSLDGFMSSNDKGNTSVEIRVGRNTNFVTRGFVSFNIDSIPNGATVKEATLKLYQISVIGNPFQIDKTIQIDHLTYGGSLDKSDYSRAALTSNITNLKGNTTIEWKTADVTDAVSDDIANARSQSQFRIHFQTENTGGDIAGDFVYFESADNSQGTGKIPQLVIDYY